MQTKTNLKIDWATHEAAKYACENWHYSKSIPVPPLLKIGVWEQKKFVGVVIFSRGATPDLLKPYGLKQTEGCELTRIALFNHKSPVSRILSIAIKFVKKTNPKVRLIVSFADPSEGHHGGIYQATNWIYSGDSAPSFKYFDSSGRQWHPRQVSATGQKKQFGIVRRVPKTSECKKIKVLGKHRYLMPLDDEMRRQIEPLRQPYPKRAGSIVADAPEVHSGEGGAEPTPALHSKEANDGST